MVAWRSRPQRRNWTARRVEISPACRFVDGVCRSANRRAPRRTLAVSPVRPIRLFEAHWIWVHGHAFLAPTASHVVNSTRLPGKTHHARTRLRCESGGDRGHSQGLPGAGRSSASSPGPTRWAAAPRSSPSTRRRSRRGRPPRTGSCRASARTAPSAAGSGCT